MIRQEALGVSGDPDVGQKFTEPIRVAGPVRYGQIPGSIGVLEAPDQPMPVGMAFEVGWTEGGLEVAVLGAEVPVRWVIVDRSSGPRNESARFEGGVFRLFSGCHSFLGATLSTR
jgi:hypothetical protein